MRDQRSVWGWYGVVSMVFCLGLSRPVQGQTWDPARFGELEDLSNRLDDDAQRLPEGDPARMEHLAESSRIKQMALEMLRTALLAGEIDEIDLDDARMLLAISYENLVTLLLDLGYCESAARQYDNALADGAILPVGQVNALQELLAAQVEGCGRGAVDTGESDPPGGTADDDVVVEDATLTETYTPHSEGSGLLPWLLMGTGGALILGGLGYDLGVVMGDVDAFQNLRDDCDEGLPCDRERYRELQSTVDEGRVIEGILYGAGVIAMTAGVLWLLMGQEEDEGDPSLALMLTGEGLGLAWSGGF